MIIMVVRVFRVLYFLFNASFFGILRGKRMILWASTLYGVSVFRFFIPPPKITKSANIQYVTTTAR